MMQPPSDPNAMMPGGMDPMSDPDIAGLLADDRGVAKARRDQIGAPVVGNLSPGVADTLYTAASLFARATETDHTLPPDGDLNDLGAFIVSTYTTMMMDPALADAAQAIDPTLLKTDQGAAQIARALTSMARDQRLLQQLKTGPANAAAPPETTGPTLAPSVGPPMLGAKQ